MHRLGSELPLPYVSARVTGSTFVAHSTRLRHFAVKLRSTP